MKSKTYSSNCTSKGKLWILVTLIIAFFMAFPVACLIKLGDWFSVDYTDRQIALLYENLWAKGLVSTGCVVSVLSGALVGIVQFWYLYSKSKVDFYHSLPVTRGRMFLQKLGEGIGFYLIPYVIMEFITICIGAARGYFSLFLMKKALLMLLIHLMIYLLTYFSVSFVISITGNILMGGFGLAALLLYGPAAGMLLFYYQSCFFKTYISPSDFTKEFLPRLSPIFLGSDFANMADVFDPFLALQVILTILAFGAGAYAAYVRRPSEKTGNSLVYSFTQAILHPLVVIPSSLGIGIVFYMIPQREESRLIWWIFGMVFGLLVSHMLMEILFHMDFRKCFSQKLLFLGAGVCVTLAALCFWLDLTGYDRYMPKEEELDNILFSSSLFGETGPVVKKREDGTYEIGAEERTASGLEAYCFDGYHVGNSSKVYEIVKKASQSSREILTQKMETGGPVLGESGGRTLAVTVQFSLKSGRKVSRTYCFEKQDIRQILQAGYQDGILKKEKYSFLEISPEYLTEVSMITVDGQGVFDPEVDRAELLKALAQDVQEADGEVLTGIPCGMLYFTFYVPVPEHAYNQIPREGTARSYLCSTLYLFPEFKRTLAILEKTGYPLSMDQVSVDQVKVQYYRTEAEPVIFSEDVVYDQKDEIRELKKAMIHPALAPVWMENSDEVPYFIARITTEALGEENNGWALFKEYCPSFILEDAQKAKQGAFGQETQLLPETENFGEITVLEESGVALDEETKKGE